MLNVPEQELRRENMNVMLSDTHQHIVIVCSAALALLDWGLNKGVQGIYNLVSLILPY